MTNPDNIEILALIIEKCNRTGAEWLSRLSNRTEKDAEAHLSFLKRKYSGLFSKISQDEVLNNLDEIMFQLSFEGSKIAGIALYKSIKRSSLQEAVEKERAIMSSRLNKVPDVNNLFVKFRRQAGVNSGVSAGIKTFATQAEYYQTPAKKFTLTYIILAAIAGGLAWFSTDAQGHGEAGKSASYSLFATFAVMALAMLIIYALYKAYLRKRISRGDRINRG